MAKSTLTTSQILTVRLLWDTEQPLTYGLGYRNIHVRPEPQYPFGRKGLMLAKAWEHAGVPFDALGILILDGDVAIDPHDNKVMHEHIWSDSESVWTAPVKVWPVSHGGSNWVWGHGRDKFDQTDVDNPNLFSFCFTYLPGRLLDSVFHDMKDWSYPHVDINMSAAARLNRIKVQVARGCQPKHMHYM
jgi:hypothetical protein